MTRTGLDAVVLSGILTRGPGPEALARWADWHARRAARRAPTDRPTEGSAEPESSHEIGRALAGASAAVGALHGWLGTADRGAALRAWFGDARLLAMLRAPDAAARIAETLDRDVARLDALLARQLDAILHHPRLARLEGSWRGLSWLADRAEADRVIRIRLLPVRWAELSRDLERAAEFDQSLLFRKTHEEEFGLAGGEPYSVMLADFEVRPGPSAAGPVDDVALLGRLAAVAAASFCPVLLPASPAMLNLDSFGEAGAAGDLTAALRAPDRARWRSLSAREDTRFLARPLISPAR